MASDGRVDELEHTYARTENEARTKLSRWMAEQVMLGREAIEVKHWTDGYKATNRRYWPGSIAAQEEAEYATPTYY